VLNVACLVTGMTLVVSCGVSQDPGAARSEDRGRDVAVLVGRIASHPELARSEGGLTEELAKTGNGLQRFGFGSPHEVGWIHETTDEERQLLEYGESAIPAIRLVLDDRSRSTALRVRLALLLGRIGGKAAAVALVDCAREASNPLLRRCAIMGLGLTREREIVLQKVLPEMTIPSHLVSWIAAMRGSLSDRTEYLAAINRILSEELVESAGLDPDIPALKASSKDGHLLLRARSSKATDDLALDLWCVAQLKATAALGVLIDALAYHDPRVQHMALALLREKVDAELTSVRTTCYDLHSLKAYSNWKSWWNENRALVIWREAASKFGRP
jgi:hypothetical protein